MAAPIKQSINPGGKGPDAWFKFFGDDFFSDVESSMPPDIQIAYLRARWVYWSKYHCEGLPTDDMILKQICRLERLNDEQWKKAKAMIFSQQPHFYLHTDNLHKKMKCCGDMNIWTHCGKRRTGIMPTELRAAGKQPISCTERIMTCNSLHAEHHAQHHAQLYAQLGANSELRLTAGEGTVQDEKNVLMNLVSGQQSIVKVRNGATVGICEMKAKRHYYEVADGDENYRHWVGGRAVIDGDYVWLCDFTHYHPAISSTASTGYDYC